MAAIPQVTRHPLSIHPAAHGGAQPGRSLQAFTAALIALLLACLLVLPTGCSRKPSSRAAQPIAPTPPEGRLQEVAPPAAVQQLQAALAERDPRVSITLPADGATLPAGPWTLRLQVRDWPLVDAGALGLGAHLAVQIDDQPVLRLTEHRSSPAGDVVETQLPALAPGSHRITAYAARPWGEAVKSPGASARIRVQTVAANPLALPAPGTPELVAVSPTAWSSAEPVLLDWLLYDAPLQHLRDGDGSWRLRVSVNGDAFLMDQNVPLWLQGWQSGSNALQLELVDGQGQPMNPPFNSLVREVKLGGGEKPRWLAGPLEPEELAVLLGEAPPPEDTPEAETAITADAREMPEVVAEPEPQEQPQPEPQPAPETAQPEAAAEPAVSPSSSSPEGVSRDGVSSDVEAAAPAAAEPLPETPAEEVPEPPEAPEPPAAQAPVEPTPAAAEPIDNPDRVAPSSSLGGSAREQVADDGTLIQPTRRGPLAGLRQRLGGS